MFLQAGKHMNPGLKSLVKHGERTSEALENLVDEFHKDKELCSYQLLNNAGSEDLLWGIVRLLGSKDASIAGHAAYIVGTLCDIDVGRRRILEIVVTYKDSGFDILTNLTNLLYCKDGESIMNAAGTIGTLAETLEGRSWMLRKDNLDDTLTKISSLLGNDNIWTASNAALVLARLTIEEEGCARILNRRDSKKVLLLLVNSLGIDEAGRGMNAAFAIGRLCDMESGRRQILMLKKSDQMLVNLTNMLGSKDCGSNKNACFALGCMAGSSDGVNRLLKHPEREKMLQRLASLLNYEDEETAWFAAMTIRTLSSKKEGCLLLRDHKIVTDALKETYKKEDLKDDIKEEIKITLEILKHLEQPRAPVVKVESSTTANVHWNPANPKSGLEVTYTLLLNDVVAFCGEETSFELRNLKPTRKYACKLQARTEGDVSPVSNAVSFSMPESVPSAPQNVHVVNRTTTQLKVGWEAPESPNGVVKGYQIVQGGNSTYITIVRSLESGEEPIYGKSFDRKSGFTETRELYQIFMNLMPGTEYTFEVYALTSVGRGDKSLLSCSTVDLRQHAPPKPNLHVLGRNEIIVQWDPPEEPLGRINYYEVNMDGEVIYSGIERSCTARRLLPKTEYTFTVAAWTNEGKCESDPAKKKTAKEKRNFPREPLYPYGKRTKNGKVKQERAPSASPKTPPKQRCKSVPSMSSPKVFRNIVERPKTSVQTAGPQPRKRVSAHMNVVRGYSADIVNRSSEKEPSIRSATRRRYFSTGQEPRGLMQDVYGQPQHMPVFRTRKKQSVSLNSSPASSIKDGMIDLEFRPSSYSPMPNPMPKSVLRQSYGQNDKTSCSGRSTGNHTVLRKSVSFDTPFSRALNDLQTIHISEKRTYDQFQPIRTTIRSVPTFSYRSTLRKST